MFVPGSAAGWGLIVFERGVWSAEWVIFLYPFGRTEFYIYRPGRQESLQGHA